MLGVLSGEKPEHDLAEFREDPGTLEQARWKQLSWRVPDKESSPCWWLTNASEEDRAQAPKLLSRSLATLRLELSAQRIATTTKIRREWEARSQQNSAAADVLHSNERWGKYS